MLVAENLTCMRSERTIFKGLGFCLQEGALLLLKGANGSGKTSLLKMIAGLIAPTEGNIYWEGTGTKSNDDFKRQLMMVGHKSAVKLDLTVEENLRFWGRLYGTEMLLPAALKFYNLGRYQETPCKELSAGWQRRVALARLIIAPCKLWLLDEPTNFLDEEAVLLTASLIESRVKQGGIVIAASHSMSSAVASHVLEIGDFS
ncbi:MAG: cytochrome c biogenesis heme-transporting ATPase CcmA [Alphaproteobacteria bacterium]|nr:cytochrome c biogenesis heme-transporting ATPase CcmA [Alphaproteobacteria bacterium]